MTGSSSGPGQDDLVRSLLPDVDYLPIQDNHSTLRALRAYGPVIADPSRWRDLLRLVQASSVNALVVDLKQEAGRLLYESSIATARRIGAVEPLFDAAALVEDLNRRGVEAVGRLVAFQDSHLADAYPDLAMRDSETGQVWRTDSGEAWLDPAQSGCHEYLAEIAIEAVELGFKEIQLDYTRFPTEGRLDRLRSSTDLVPDTRTQAIESFLELTAEAVHTVDGRLAVDVFGVVATAGDDQGIGQVLEGVARQVDVLCPMLYAEHYPQGWLGLPEPSSHPAAIVGHALDRALNRLPDGPTIRPWLQGWNLTSTSVLSQIAEAENRGIGWMLWNSRSAYDPLCLPSRTPLS